MGKKLLVLASLPLSNLANAKQTRHSKTSLRRLRESSSFYSDPSYESWALRDNAVDVNRRLVGGGEAYLAESISMPMDLLSMNDALGSMSTFSMNMLSLDTVSEVAYDWVDSEISFSLSMDFSNGALQTATPSTRMSSTGSEVTTTSSASTTGVASTTTVAETDFQWALNEEQLSGNGLDYFSISMPKTSMPEDDDINVEENNDETALPTVKPTNRGFTWVVDKTDAPSKEPSASPVTKSPSGSPILSPVVMESDAPSSKPSSSEPTSSPQSIPSVQPSSSSPTRISSLSPVVMESDAPSSELSISSPITSPADMESDMPSSEPSTTSPSASPLEPSASPVTVAPASISSTGEPSASPIPMIHCPPAYNSSKTSYTSGETVEVNNAIWECFYEVYCNEAEFDSTKFKAEEEELWLNAWRHVGDCYRAVSPATGSPVTLNPSQSPTESPVTFSPTNAPSFMVTTLAPTTARSGIVDTPTFATSSPTRDIAATQPPTESLLISFVYNTSVVFDGISEPMDEEEITEFEQIATGYMMDAFMSNDEEDMQVFIHSVTVIEQRVLYDDDATLANGNATMFESDVTNESSLGGKAGKGMKLKGPKRKQRRLASSLQVDISIEGEMERGAPDSYSIEDDLQDELENGQVELIQRLAENSSFFEDLKMEDNELVLSPSYVEGQHEDNDSISHNQWVMLIVGGSVALAVLVGSMFFMEQKTRRKNARRVINEDGIEAYDLDHLSADDMGRDMEEGSGKRNAEGAAVSPKSVKSVKMESRAKKSLMDEGEVR